MHNRTLSSRTPQASKFLFIDHCDATGRPTTWFSPHDQRMARRREADHGDGASEKCCRCHCCTELHNKRLKTETGKDHIFCVLRHMLLKENGHKVKREKIKGPAETFQKPEKRTPAPTVAWDVVSHAPSHKVSTRPQRLTELRKKGKWRRDTLPPSPRTLSPQIGLFLSRS